jgi:hypothetical protein
LFTQFGVKTYVWGREQFSVPLSNFVPWLQRESHKALQEKRVFLFLPFSQISSRDQDISMIMITRWKKWLPNPKETTSMNPWTLVLCWWRKPFKITVLSLLLRLQNFKQGLYICVAAPSASYRARPTTTELTGQTGLVWAPRANPCSFNRFSASTSFSMQSQHQL